jgi:type I restriction enzyme R subunit
MNDRAAARREVQGPGGPAALVFVCAMWLTGFDAPSCSTIYLDKPMRNHTLMQTIARANRVFPGKHSGMIVDYANVFASLEKALAIYGQGQGGAMPVRDNIEKLPAGSMERLERLDHSPWNALHFAKPATQSNSLTHQRTGGQTLQRAVMPDPAAIEFAPRELSSGRHCRRHQVRG